MEFVKFKVDIVIQNKDIQDLLVCAFEGGSNYWYEKLEPIEETVKAQHASDRFYGNMMKHGFLLVDKETGKRHRVVPSQFVTALQLMHSKFTSHFADIQRESTDAETGDIFLQLLVHGDVIYG